MFLCSSFLSQLTPFMLLCSPFLFQLTQFMFPCSLVSTSKQHHSCCCLPLTKSDRDCGFWASSYLMLYHFLVQITPLTLLSSFFSSVPIKVFHVVFPVCVPVNAIYVSVFPFSVPNIHVAVFPFSVPITVNNNRLFMAPHLVRDQSAYKDIRIR